MEALRQLVRPTNGTITIVLPEQYANEELEVIVRTLPQKDNSVSNNKKKYDFSDLLGKLQWKGNPLDEQKKLRDEWK